MMMHRSIKIAAFAALAFSAPALAFAAGYGDASPSEIAVVRKCESLPQHDATHSKECRAMGANHPELFSPAYRSRMNIGEHAAPATFAPAPHVGACSHADHAHGRC
jgi:hypothetical protein